MGLLGSVFGGFSISVELVVSEQTTRGKKRDIRFPVARFLPDVTFLLITLKSRLYSPISCLIVYKRVAMRVSSIEYVIVIKD
jgi:hypothetical protein